MFYFPVVQVCATCEEVLEQFWEEEEEEWHFKESVRSPGGQVGFTEMKWNVNSLLAVETRYCACMS